MATTSGFLNFCENEFRHIANLEETEPLYPYDLSKLDDYPNAWPYAIIFANDTGYAIETKNPDLKKLNTQALEQLHKIKKQKFTDMTPNDWYIWKMRNIDNELATFHTEYQVYYRLGNYDRIRDTINKRMTERPSNRPLH